jgi:two-component system sensor histidine kinase ResE
VFIFRSVVGKLWLTIIGLVAVVLLILGLFLVNYIGDYFSQARDQKASLEKLASRLSVDAGRHLNDPQFFALSNELLANQAARMLIVSTDLQESAPPAVSSDNLKSYHAADFFSSADLKQVLTGRVMMSQITSDQGSGFRSGIGYLAVAVPLHNEAGAIVGAMVIYQSMQSLEATQSYVLRLFIYVSIIGFLMTTFFAFFLFSRITRPLQQLNKAADLITQGEYGTRVPILSKDEIGELAKTFNHMGEELQDSIKALSQEKEHLSSVLRSMTDAVITLDAEGMVILTNPQGERIIHEWGAIHWTDEPAERLSNKTPRDGCESVSSGYSVQQIPAPLQPLFESVLTESKQTAAKVHVHNGVWSVAMTPLYSRDQIRGAVAVLRDVTEEHRLDKLRKDFVANVSHELRTPLSMLQGYSEALIDDIAVTPEERNELAQVIYDESLRMGRLVRDLLDLARMEAGHLELNFHEVELTSLIKRMHRKFSVLSKDSGITLTAELPDHPLILHKADEDRLEQVLTNLLDNAFRHTPAGAHIAVKVQPAVWRDAPAMRLEVTDEGRGIPAEDLPFIFERFYKADKARTRGTALGGTGLGLAIVKNIVDSHQGTVSAQSAVGQGTTFTILLPVDMK